MPRFRHSFLLWIGLAGRIAVVTLPSADARSDTVPGVDCYVRSASSVLLAHVPTASEAGTLPVDSKHFLIVDQTIKGFDTDRYLPYPDGKLDVGQPVLVLIPFPDARYELDGMPSTACGFAQSSPYVWPIKTSTIDTRGVPLETLGGPGGFPCSNFDHDLDRRAVMAMMTHSAPEEVGLQQQMLDCLLFPDRFAALAKKDPDRATFVRLACAARDLSRDVPHLSGLLESPDAEVRRAATAYLQAITGAEIPVPEKNDPVSLHQHALAWSAWWSSHRDLLIWNEPRLAFVRRVDRKPPFSEPPIPADWKPNDDGTPFALVDAMGSNRGKPNAEAFAPAFRAFLDDCGPRDLYLKMMIPLSRGQSSQRRETPKLPPWLKAADVENGLSFGTSYSDFGWAVEASGFPACVQGGSGPFLPPTPRLRQDLLLNPSVPANDRTGLVALFAYALSNNDRFVADRRVASAYLNRPDAEMELVRRTAFWTVAQGNYSSTLGCVAQDRLGQSTEQDDQRVLARIFLGHPTACSFDAVRHSIDAGHELFTKMLLEHLRTGSGPSFHWAGRLLAQQREARVIPALSARLSDGDSSVRWDAAFDLCWIPSHTAIPNLLAELHKESDARVKNMILTAISQTDDPRSFDDLMVAAQVADDPVVVTELVRGLARSKDARALPVIGAIALNARDEQTRCEAIEAFGYISGLYRGFAPNPFWTSSGFNPEERREHLPAIRRWMESHSADATK